MAISDAYATAEEYRDGISPKKTDTTEDTPIGRDLLAVTRYLENKLGRFFGKDGSAVDRDFFAPYSGPINPEADNPWKFAGKYSNVLHLDTEVVSISSVKTDDDGDGTPETTWAPADFMLLPLNADKGPEPRPFSAISTTSYGTYSGWPTARLVRINGIWGWPAVPASIKNGVIQLTAIYRLESPRATSQVNEVGSVIEMSTEGKNIVRDLVKVYTRGSY